MKVKKVLTRFASAPEDEQELRRVSRALGDELPRHRLDVLRTFRAGLARIVLPARSFAAGYVAGLLDTTAEFESALSKSADDDELKVLAKREGWRDLLKLLRDGPRLPSDIADRLGRDRPTVTRVLKRMRAAGLVQAYANENLDGRTRPHRLTIQGRRMLSQLEHDSEVSPELQTGISIAVGLFRHLVTHNASPATALDAIANSIIDNPLAAAQAVSIWADESRQAGLITELGNDRTQEAYSLAADRPGAARRQDALWHDIPDILQQIRARQGENVPVYVRTENAWGAWAYALQERDTTGMSRTIVRGDILSQAVEPPAQRFDLIYDDPAMIQSDRNEPTMQEFLKRADAKYVVASRDEEVPEGFIQLKLASEED